MKTVTTLILVIIAPFLLFCLSGCQAGLSSLKPVLDEEGEVFVYLQPFPQEAERLKFNLEGISAVRQDGSEIPLSLLFNKFEAPDVKRQRLLAQGILPPGMYRGLSFKAAKAVLTTEEGEASLLTTEKPVNADFPFSITRKKASTLAMSFLYQKSVASGFSFSPVFSVYQPAKPVTGLLGYVSNSGANTITVFDKKAGQVVTVLATGRAPKGIVFDQVRNRAYVALSGEDAIEAIDMITGDSFKTIQLHDGAAPQHLALTPDGRLLMSVNPGSKSVSFIDPLSYLELSHTAAGDAPSSILLEPAGGRRAYVFNVMSNSISIVDIAARATAATAAVDTGALRGQFNRNGSRLYVISEGSPYLTVIDPASLQVSNRVFMGIPANALKVDVKTDLIYAAGIKTNEVEIYEPLSLIAVESIPAEGGASYLTIDGQENSLLLLSPESRTLTSVNINTRNIVFVIDVGEDPYQVTLMGER
jgi:DNA-binding beta-propeller fold protein YncE